MITAHVLIYRLLMCHTVQMHVLTVLISEIRKCSCALVLMCLNSTAPVSHCSNACSNNAHKRNFKMLMCISAHVLKFDCSCGRTRYLKDCLNRFATFVSLHENNPTWKDFFVDKGQGSPPVTYLAAVEEGLRNYVDDPYAMGSDAMSSQENGPPSTFGGSVRPTSLSLDSSLKDNRTASDMISCS